MRRFSPFSKRFLAFIFVLIGVVTAHAVFAQTSNQLGLEQVQGESGLASGNLTLIIARIIRGFFGLLGIVAVGLIVWAGVVWMTAGGNEEKVTQAKTMIKNATIGLAIILMSFGIVSFIISSIVNGVNGTEGDSYSGGGTPPGGFVGGGELGQTIEYVLPKPGETDVSRDTAIIVQFKVPLQLSGLLTDSVDATKPVVSGLLNTNNVKVYVTSLGVASALPASEVTANVGFQTETLADGTVYKRPLLTIVPKNLLGNANSNTAYSVKLSGLKKEDPLSGTGDLFKTGEGYTWNFTVGTKVDLQPPKLLSVYPSKNSTNNYRNAIVTVNFDKAMLPSSVLDPATSGIKVIKEGTVVDGTWNVVNLAQSLEFRPNNPCGKSACGDQFYCLPQDSTITIQATAASIDTVRGTPKGVMGTGLLSLNLNSFDGNNDGKADGSPTDNYTMTFGVGSVLDTTGPGITQVTPTIAQSFVAPVAPLALTFDEPLLLSTIGGVQLGQPANFTQWFFPGADDLDANGNIATGASSVITQTRINLSHAPFLPSTETKVYSYMPGANEKIRDRQNNCYVPGRSTSCAATADKPFCCDGVPSSVATACTSKFEATN